MTAEEILALRLSLGETQEEFATRFHVGIKTVSRWENGHFSPDRRTLAALLWEHRKQQKTVLVIKEK